MATASSSERSKPPPPGVPHKDLGDFVLLERIGEGGMGVVFRAMQKSLNRPVAVKVLSPKVAKDAEFLERFSREAKAAAALNHANIVGAIAVGEAHGLHYFAMELLEGQTVRQRLEASGPLPFADILEIGRQTALALAHAHRKGLLHRDIKPENLMLLEERGGLTVKVMDFGLVRLVRQDGSLTQEGIALGTPLYTSPEQARGSKDLTPGCDLYSLGATLFHLATGRPPFEGDTAVAIMTQHVTQAPPDPKLLNPDLPDEFCALLLQLLSKEPRERYESAAALAEDFEAAISGSAAPTAEAEPGTAGAPPASRHAGTGKAAPVFKRRAFTKRDRPARSSSLLPLAVVFLLLVIGGAGAYYYVALRPKAGAVPEAASKKTGPDPATVAAEQERQRGEQLLAAALKVEKEQPDDFEAQRKAWTEVRTTGAAWRHVELADSKLDALSIKFSAAATKAISDAVTKARDAANAGDHNAALALLEAFPQQYQQGSGKEVIETAMTRIRARAQAEGEKLLKRAADLESAGDQKAILEAYTAAAQFKYEPIAGKAKAKLAALKKSTPEAPKEQAKEVAPEQPAPAPEDEKKPPPEADRKEALAAKAWEDAETLFVARQYEAAQRAFLKFKADYLGTRTLAARNQKLSLRLEALDVLVTPPAPKPPPAKR